MSTFNDLMDTGLVIPYAPLWSHFQHLAHPRDYQDWVDYDLAIIDKMDACVRLNAVGFIAGGSPVNYKVYTQIDSSGADGEVARFKEQSKPVFYSVNDVVNWALRWIEENN